MCTLDGIQFKFSLPSDEMVWKLWICTSGNRSYWFSDAGMQRVCVRDERGEVILQRPVAGPVNNSVLRYVCARIACPHFRGVLLLLEVFPRIKFGALGRQLWLAVLRLDSGQVDLCFRLPLGANEACLSEHHVCWIETDESCQFVGRRCRWSFDEKNGLRLASDIQTSATMPKGDKINEVCCIDANGASLISMTKDGERSSYLWEAPPSNLLRQVPFLNHRLVCDVNVARGGRWILTKSLLSGPSESPYTLFELDTDGQFRTLSSRVLPIPFKETPLHDCLCANVLREYLGLKFGWCQSISLGELPLFGCEWWDSLDETCLCLGIGSDYYQIELHRARDSLRNLTLAHAAFFAETHSSFETLCECLPDDSSRELANGFLDWARRRAMLTSSHPPISTDAVVG